jgi:tripartite-type tricarboxylate transporter receptor subunit TctC
MEMHVVLVRLVTVAALMFGVVSSAQAQNYPNRPVRVIVPFGAGGSSDFTTRLVGEKLGEKLGQRFVVENMPGAGGISAARAVLSAGADGHTLALFAASTAISVGLFKNLPFDPLKDFTPISRIGFTDCIFVTSIDSEFRTLADFLKVAREKPSSLNVGTVAVGSTQHLSAELFKSMAGINFVIVPFRSSPEALVALLRNDIQMMIDFPPALRAALSDRKLNVLAATGPVSAKLLNVPTVKEAGIPDYQADSWNALYAPAGSPKESIEVINRALRAVVAESELKKRILEVGFETQAGSPEELDSLMRADIAKWGKVIEQAGIGKQ